MRKSIFPRIIMGNFKFGYSKFKLRANVENMERKRREKMREKIKYEIDTKKSR